MPDRSGTVPAAPEPKNMPKFRFFGKSEKSKKNDEKGTAAAPECGFSKNAAAKLMALEIDFDTVDVQKDSKLRDAVKAFSSWPTFPQLFVEGELFCCSEGKARMCMDAGTRRTSGPACEACGRNGRAMSRDLRGGRPAAHGKARGGHLLVSWPAVRTRRRHRRLWRRWWLLLLLL